MRRKRCLILTIFLVLVHMFTTSAYAKSFYEPIDVTIPVYVDLGGDVKLETDNEDAPFPEKDTIHVKDGEVGKFIFSYDEPEHFKYKLQQVNMDDKNIVYDKTVYDIDVFISEDTSEKLQAKITVVKEDGSSKSEVVHLKNEKVKKPASGGSTPQTGDDLNKKELFSIMGTVLIGFITSILLIKKKSRN